MNNGYFLRKEIEKTRQIIRENQYKLKYLEEICKDVRVMEILSNYLVVQEGKIDEDSFYDYITLKEGALDPIETSEDPEIVGIEVGIIKKFLEERK